MPSTEFFVSATMDEGKIPAYEMSLAQSPARGDMTVRHHFVVWVAAGTAALLILGAILMWRSRSSADRWNTFLTGDPLAGAETFKQKGCANCHSVLGVGGTLAPDLGLRGAAGASMNDLVTQMWNHAPRMWEQIRISKINYPSVYAGRNGKPLSPTSTLPATTMNRATGFTGSCCSHRKGASAAIRSGTPQAASGPI